MSIVMPFGGDVADAPAALAVLRGLEVGPRDERILADNTESLPVGAQGGIEIVPVPGERSPAHARNVGAGAGGGEWILFIDSDCDAPRDLLERYLTPPPGPQVGALVGQVRPALRGPATLAARYGSSRNFLDQRAHLAHPYRPRAAAANLMVRRNAFQAVGGFLEGLRAGEDTDFSWRLQEAGWRLELREDAVVEHEYRAGLRELRRQWRGYAAGRAWLRRRYADFRPEPAVARAAGRVIGRVRTGGRQTSPVSHPAAGVPPRPATSPRSPEAGRSPADRAKFAAIDGLLALEELVGFTLSNRPAGPPVSARARTVFIAERFPLPGDPLVDLAGISRDARVEAATRPSTPARAELPVLYREDDGTLQRLKALLALISRRPLVVLRDLLVRDPPSTWELACVACRVRDARIVPLGRTQPTAGRIAKLAGRNESSSVPPSTGRT